MKNNLIAVTLLGLLGVLAAPLQTAQAQGTAFSYQGSLNDGGNPANGSYDLSFAAFDAASAGNLLGVIVTNFSVNVSNGLFTTTVDLGSSVFIGSNVWLEVSVSTNAASTFTILTPRQQFLPTPYAILAGTAALAGANSVNADSIMPEAIDARKISNGAVVRSLNGLTDTVTISAGTNLTITPNGNNLTLSAVGGGGSGIWSVFSNNAYFNAGNVGIGTANPAEKLTLAGVTSYNTGLKVTGGSTSGTGIVLENTAAGGHKYDLVSGGAADGIGAGAFGLYDETAANYRLVLATNGNLGIGTANPNTTLDIFGGSHILSLTAYGPDVTFKDTGNNNARNVIQSINGDLNFFTESYMSGVNPFAFLKLANNGKVGIGNSQPQANLDIYSPEHALAMTASGPDVTFYDNSHGYARNVIQSINGDLNFFTESYMSGGKPIAFLKLANNGNVGIGNSQPQANLDIYSPQHALAMTASGPDVTFYDNSHGYARNVIQSINGDLNFFTESYMSGANTLAFLKLANNGNVGIGNATPQSKLDVLGNTRTCSLTITAGCDVAEPFPLESVDTPKGTVVVIDREHPGQLKSSSHSYDRRVAGIVSGANGINPGISLQQAGAFDTGQNVALSGRVYVLAEADSSPIEPGDLLTTSEVPGHAMKVTDYTKAQGAILGKAMSALDKGKGMVLVLVSLQ